MLPIKSKLFGILSSESIFNPTQNTKEGSSIPISNAGLLESSPCPIVSNSISFGVPTNPSSSIESNQNSKSSFENFCQNLERNNVPLKYEYKNVHMKDALPLKHDIDLDFWCEI